MAIVAVTNRVIAFDPLKVYRFSAVYFVFLQVFIIFSQSEVLVVQMNTDLLMENVVQCAI